MGVADYISGPDTINYTPGSDTAAAVVVILSTDHVGITKVSIPANTQGVLHVQGLFNIDCASGTTFSQGAKLYYNAGTAKVTTTNTDVYIGRAAKAKVSGELKALVRLNAP